MLTYNQKDRPGFIYAIRCSTSGKYYIGQTINVKHRLLQHQKELERNDHFNDHLQRSFNLYGEESFVFAIIDTCDLSVLDSREIFWINHFKSYDPKYGFNRQYGGVKSRKHTAEVRQKMSDSHKGKKRRPLSEETKAKISASNKGRVVTDETRKRQSDSHKGKKWGEEQKRKMKEIIRNVVRTPEWRKNISNGLRGKKRTPEFAKAVGDRCRGKKHTDEHKEKISAGLVRAYLEKRR